MPLVDDAAAAAALCFATIFDRTRCVCSESLTYTYKYMRKSNDTCAWLVIIDHVNAGVHNFVKSDLFNVTRGYVHASVFRAKKLYLCNKHPIIPIEFLIE